MRAVNALDYLEAAILDDESDRLMAALLRDTRALVEELGLAGPDPAPVVVAVERRREPEKGNAGDEIGMGA